MSTAIPRPQLNSDEMRRLKWLLGGMVALVSLWTVFFLEVEALSLVVVTSAAILAAMIWPQLPAHIPALVWRLSVPAIVIAIGTDFYLSPDTLSALIRLAILLVLYRAISYRRKREDLQLIVLGLFLIVVAGVLTVSLGFALLLLLFTACALGFLFVVTLIDMTDTGPRVMRPEEMREVPAWAKTGWGNFFVRLRQVADWRLLGFAGGLFVLVVGFSAVLFMVIPRFEMGSGFFLDKYITRKSRTGFSESIKFGDVSDLVRDESVVMRVDLTDAASLREPPYWRMTVLDEYTKQGFQMSAELKKKMIGTQRTRQIVAGRRGLPVGTGMVGGIWTFYVEPEVSRFLPLPGTFSTLHLREPQPLQRNREQQLIALRTEPMAMTAFQLDGVELDPTVLDPGFAEQLAGRGSGDSLREYDGRVTLRGPKGEENETALHRIVDEITAGEKLEATLFSRRATDWLRARHSYALSARIPAGTKDDIVKWLESNEPGFCEHFAASLTVLCRAAGHPARVVVGFHGGVLNAFEKYYMVKNSDAHAWAEIFDGRGKWFRADAVPAAVASTLINGAAATPLISALESDKSWKARFDSLRVIWYRHIVNFDAQQQVKMLEGVKAFTSDTGNALRVQLDALMVRLKAWLAGPWDYTRAGRVLQLVVALAVMIWAVIRAWYWSRMLWLMWWQPRSYDPVRTEAGRWLGEIGRYREPNAPPDEMVAQVEADLLRLRYGSRESWPEPRAVFSQARQARRAVRSARPRFAASDKR